MTPGYTANSPGPWTTRCANIVLIVTSLYALAWSIFAIAGHKPQIYLKLGPAVVAVAAGAFLLAKPAMRLLAVSAILGVFTGLQATEMLARYLVDTERADRARLKAAALEGGIAFDGRSKLDLIMEMRRRQVAAYPPFYPHRIIDAPLAVGGAPAIPLASKANIVTVCCNELGQFLIYGTDEHGFNNPRGLWSRAPIDIAIVGSSSAVGEAVPLEDNLASQLRSRYPSTLSLGAGGNGPLLELASIAEYLPVLQPKRVLWLFGESLSPPELEHETGNPLLRRYLDAGFTQDLVHRQDAVDLAVKEYLEDAIRQEIASRTVPLETSLQQFATLKRVREFVSNVSVTADAPRHQRMAAEAIEPILRRGQEIARQWGGAITLVYLPDSRRYYGETLTVATLQAYRDTHENYLHAAASLGIPVIDMDPVFARIPSSQFAGRSGLFFPYLAHYRPAAYRLVAKTILESLQ